ncbi:MAG: hypothetical protein JWL64_977 [Frankiales bacterium]|nr:hypothetical protein [Frankiales bacterium]
MSAAEVVEVAVPFGWLGMVLAISILEAPLKFRAPGVTLPLGLGIGRLVFRALNAVEGALLVVLVVAGAVGSMPGVSWWLVAALGALLAVQVLVLRPPLDRRAVLIIGGQTPPPSRLHLIYIALEACKIILLPVLGTVLATRILT